MNELNELLTELKSRLAESKKSQYAFTEHEVSYTNGREAELESIIELIEEKIISITI